jgi:hypothetical protein
VHRILTGPAGIKKTRKKGGEEKVEVICSVHKQHDFVIHGINALSIYCTILHTVVGFLCQWQHK